MRCNDSRAGFFLHDLHYLCRDPQGNATGKKPVLSQNVFSYTSLYYLFLIMILIQEAKK
jgi:hypothetical protein